MKAIEILFPVFFMMFLGWLSHRRGWVTAGQNEGAKSLVFNILFPLLVFHVLVKAKLSTNFIYEILFLDAAWILAYGKTNYYSPFHRCRYRRYSR